MSENRYDYNNRSTSRFDTSQISQAEHRKRVEKSLSEQKSLTEKSNELAKQQLRAMAALNEQQEQIAKNLQEQNEAVKRKADAEEQQKSYRNLAYELNKMLTKSASPSATTRPLEKLIIGRYCEAIMAQSGLTESAMDSHEDKVRTGELIEKIEQTIEENTKNLEIDESEWIEDITTYRKAINALKNKITNIKIETKQTPDKPDIEGIAKSDYAKVFSTMFPIPAIIAVILALNQKNTNSAAIIWCGAFILASIAIAAAYIVKTNQEDAIEAQSTWEEECKKVAKENELLIAQNPERNELLQQLKEEESKLNERISELPHLADGLVVGNRCIVSGEII